jgi:hypothetical protein
MQAPLISSIERKRLLLFSLLVVLLTMLPIVIGYSVQTPQMRFNGAAFGWADFTVHITTIRAGMQNNWQYTFFFTPIPQQGHYIKLFYQTLGQLGKFFTNSPLAIFYTSLAVFNFIACQLIYRMIAEFFRQPKYRFLAFLLAIFGSGLGWLVSIAQLLPKTGPVAIDFWLYDAFPYLGMTCCPNFSAIISGQLGFIILFLKYCRQPKSTHLVVMAILGLMLQAIQPFSPLIPFILLSGILLGDWITTQQLPLKNTLALGLVGIAQLPLLAYNFWVVSSDPFWKIYTSQALTATPPIIYLLLGFFWFWILLLPGLFRPKKFFTPKRIGLLVWVILILLLVYLPWQMQRRILFYYTLPLAILVSLVIREQLSPWLSRRLSLKTEHKNILLVPLVILVGFTNLYILFVHTTYQLPALQNSYYHPASIARAISWMEQHTEPDSVMLSTPDTAFLAAVQIGQRVFVAHPDETANYSLRVSQMKGFFNNQVNLSEMEPANLRWVFYGPYEQSIGPNFQPPSNLQPAYQQEGITIYEIYGEP